MRTPETRLSDDPVCGPLKPCIAIQDRPRHTPRAPAGLPSSTRTRSGAAHKSNDPRPHEEIERLTSCSLCEGVCLHSLHVLIPWRYAQLTSRSRPLPTLCAEMATTKLPFARSRIQAGRPLIFELLRVSLYTPERHSTRPNRFVRSYASFQE